MRIQVFCLSLFVVAITASVVSAQAVPKPPPVAPPAIPPLQRQFIMQPVQLRDARRSPNLSDLVLAKMDLNKETPKVILMIESFRTELKKVKVTRLKTEERVREVKVGDQAVLQTYTVNVPVIEEREVKEQVPAGRKPMSIEAKDIEFFNLDGEVVSIDDAGKILTQLHPVFLLDHGTQPLPLRAIVKQAMREDCLIAVTKKVIRERPNPRWAVPVDVQRARPFVVPQPAQP